MGKLKLKKLKKVYMPFGMGGLFYFEEQEKHLIKLKPIHIVYLTVAILVIEVLMKILV